MPLRVHRAASGWAHAQVAEQLEAAAEEAAVDQGGLRTGQAKVAGGVTDLQLALERTGLYLLELSRSIPGHPKSARSAASRRSTPPTP